MIHKGTIHFMHIRVLFRNLHPTVFTASIRTIYRKPVMANTTAVLRAKLMSSEGRKLNLSATLEDPQGNILADCQSLFIARIHK
jgi:acyl-CoA thioesterase FadM